ncbi:MAG: fucose isomerase [Succinivibrio sp.]|nr:fucose isomerase [Succinivibrio sp.]
MLKNIPELITPDFLYALDAMGHGDCLVLADANFPAYRIARHATLVHLPCLSALQVLEAVLTLLPVDAAHANPGYVMAVSAADKAQGLKTPIWQDFEQRLKAATGRQEPLGELERFDFYDKAAQAELIVQTGERALYGNLMLYKGCL